jgi:bifunctional UDP-N-acetylglucosamine pyrophosphorylase / glucosamine-1-phosphate N-acetyltransferase
MRRVLVVPAAGLGTRLGSTLPKALTPVAGRPMIDYVLTRGAAYCQSAVVIAHPSARAGLEAYAMSAPLLVSLVEQASPTGMLDAILLAGAAVAASDAERVWIAWCDQVLLSAATADRVVAREQAADRPEAVFPTVRQSPPYIHFERDAAGRISGVRQRREGDLMPESGESDAGFFSLSRAAFLERLSAYTSQSLPGRGTGERNFLPFLAWAESVATVPLADPVEARGINTPEDLAFAESILRSRDPR